MVAAVGETLLSRWIASGPQVAAFEKALSDYVAGRPVRSFTSATGAMEVALQLLGIGAGDEVITPAQSFFASANVIERVGARVVFVDVEPATRNVDLAAASAAVTPRTKALLPVHYNAPLDPQALAAFRARHGVRIVEDAALAIGSRAGGRPVGATGDLVSFSFHPNKNMTTIEGGALVVNDAREAAAVEKLRFHGIARLPDGTRDVEMAGGKYNLSDVSARLGLAQLARLDEWCAARGRLAMHYFACLEGDELLAPERLPPRTNPGHSWNMFTVLLPLDRIALTRRHFIDAMQREGIGVGLSYEAIHLTSHYRSRGWREGQFPVSERIGRETVTLPLFPEMTPGDVERVCETARRVLRSRPA
ncbi:MAG: DegT/DnrJ/EryC1/StrS aminotransferase family protein [Betaproteobacteria bacterium]|nr:DegT/DnrJ/EryC1/StrS aminotransferase family protein [Betaproteobacteria bacterium]PWB61958.1 MAG: aminotransferase DegT [Betaproteobacteria bacterium]